MNEAPQGGGRASSSRSRSPQPPAPPSRAPATRRCDQARADAAHRFFSGRQSSRRDTDRRGAAPRSVPRRKDFRTCFRAGRDARRLGQPAVQSPNTSSRPRTRKAVRGTGVAFDRLGPSPTRRSRRRSRPVRQGICRATSRARGHNAGAEFVRSASARLLGAETPCPLHQARTMNSRRRRSSTRSASTATWSESPKWPHGPIRDSVNKFRRRPV